ncbi:hypothetical protein BA059_09820 [Mycolicibacterium sp. (ex Dasyatis americana)]|uniref:Uncharacterized protein n=1 Tax=Mycobacterium syngnathidarum TaxID=1908205 RepID=A0A1S1K628_9MYCO|nr:hypothetical protein BA059_09820 [Mycolicibacterium sp. (ex Dasyatis americana)]OHU01329.1 hypothetical protein BKG61_09875 [Mycobacterium syngnathidarum]OLT95316.1 hypothetical protein BKG60_15750 [Mycobacterium syngnathidarum]
MTPSLVGGGPLKQELETSDICENTACGCIQLPSVATAFEFVASNSDAGMHSVNFQSRLIGGHHMDVRIALAS